MTVYEAAITKIQQLPESLVREVTDFIDFLLSKQRATSEELRHAAEGLQIAESDFSDYLTNLEQYEERLARGEIRW